MGIDVVNRRQFVRVIAAGSLLGAGAASLKADDSKEVDYVKVYKDLRPTFITLDLTPDKGGGVSSGVALDLNKYGRGIITNAHCVVSSSQAAIDSVGNAREELLLAEAKKDIRITLPDGKVIKGRPLIVNKDGRLRAAIHPDLDLAIVIPETDITQNTKAAKLASKSPPVGTQIISMGNHGGGYNPKGMVFYVGEFKGITEGLYGRGTPVKVTIAELTTCIRGGDSGSGAHRVDTGELIGINYSSISGDGVNDARALAVESVRSFLNMYGVELA